MTRCHAARPDGFSLLEMLVAIAIAAMTLIALYHASGGSVRAAAEIDRQTRAIIAAESLLALHGQVGPDGVHATGRFEDGMDWDVTSTPLDSARSTRQRMQHIVVTVRWPQDRQLQLVGVVPERAP
ncbi:type IV pilus modification PilV family protein [Rhodocyclaceae bacterium SMB388]